MTNQHQPPFVKEEYTGMSTKAFTIWMMLIIGMQAAVVLWYYL